MKRILVSLSLALALACTVAGPSVAQKRCPGDDYHRLAVGEGFGANRPAAQAAAKTDFTTDVSKITDELKVLARQFHCPAGCPYRSISSVVGKDYDDQFKGYVKIKR